MIVVDEQPGRGPVDLQPDGEFLESPVEPDGGAGAHAEIVAESGRQAKAELRAQKIVESYSPQFFEQQVP